MNPGAFQEPLAAILPKREPLPVLDEKEVPAETPDPAPATEPDLPPEPPVSPAEDAEQEEPAGQLADEPDAGPQQAAA